MLFEKMGYDIRCLLRYSLTRSMNSPLSWGDIVVYISCYIGGSEGQKIGYVGNIVSRCLVGDTKIDGKGIQSLT